MSSATDMSPGEEAGTAVDRQTARLLDELDAMSGDAKVSFADIGVELAREGSRAIWQAFAGTADATCGSRDIRIDGAGTAIPARLYSPSDSGGSAPLPLVVFLHGGGWAMGDLDSYDGLVRSLCSQSGARMLSVDYRLSPEHRFPAGLDDALRAVHWARSASDELEIDPTRIALMGDSAGGNLAAVAARRLHIENSIAMQALFLMYPVLDLSSPHNAYPSRLAYGDGEYLLTRDSIDVTLSWYLGPNDRADDPDVSPLLAPDLHCLPPTVIVAAGRDPLLDESLRYTDMLETAGVPTTFKCFDRTIHGFLSFGVLDVAGRGRACLASEIRRLLF